MPPDKLQALKEHNRRMFDQFIRKAAALVDMTEKTLASGGITIYIPTLEGRLSRKCKTTFDDNPTLD